jgi:hypothetical protein
MRFGDDFMQAEGVLVGAGFCGSGVDFDFDNFFFLFSVALDGCGVIFKFVVEVEGVCKIDDALLVVKNGAVEVGQDRHVPLGVDGDGFGFDGSEEGLLGESIFFIELV